MKNILVLFLGIVLFSASAWSQDAQSLIKQGDEFYRKFDNEKALENYLAALKLDQNNHEALWKTSRAYVDIAEHMPAETDEQEDAQLKMYEKGLEYAEKAIKTDPGSMMGYLRRAIVKGRIALFKGVFNAISLVNDVKEDVEKAIKLGNAPDDQVAVAHYVLARAHAKVCDKPYLVRLPLGLGWGDRDVAAEEYEKAISLNPKFIMFRLDAARNYVEMDEYQKAKDHLYKIPYLPISDEDDKQFKKEAAELLEEIKNE
ncbi:MAG: hypothetical protein GXO82_09470 [Chlorobi bacterium]|nr:hypothetical protein [Chlorobiota bacterium]